MKRYTTIALVAALAATLFATTGCLRRVPLEYTPTQGPADWSSQTLPLDPAAKSIAARVTLGAGRLELTSTDLGADAMYVRSYDGPRTRTPHYRVRLDGDVMNVGVEQQEIAEFPFGREVHSEYDIRLAQGIPTELELELGAGEGDIDLSRVDLTALSLDMGAGSATVDLSGPRAHRFSGTIQAGAGEIVIRLPEDIPVRVMGRNDGIGEWSFDGFTTDGNYVVNDAWQAMESGDSTATGGIELNVQRGIGRVELKLVD